MAQLEKYLRLDPGGELSWIAIDRDHFLHDLFEAIGCRGVEHVQLLHGLECLVDEFGAIAGHQPINLLASILYGGFFYEVPLFGSVIFVRTGIGSSGEPEWLPLQPGHIRALEFLFDFDIPDPEV